MAASPSPRGDARGAHGTSDVGMRASDIATKRVYEPASPDDGARVLVMRLWPRGIRKQHVTVWLKELGPVPALLRAFRSGRVGWTEYVPQYLAGLERPEAQAAIAEVRRRARGGRVTLLCGCPDERRCHRSLLRAYLLDSSAARARSPRAGAARRPAHRRRA
jgi:uncharacterized protein YeaO (DUF488 family)